MEEIIVTLMFLYPGALVELFYEKYAKYSYKPGNSYEKVKLVEYFIRSVIISTLTILLYKSLVQAEFDTFAGMIEEFSLLGNAFLYCLLAFCVTGVYAFLRYCLAGMKPRIPGQSLTAEKVNGCEVVGSVTSWRDLVYGPGKEELLAHCIVRIRMGEQVVAGFAECLPTDFENGINLTQTDIVGKQLRAERGYAHDQCYIGKPYLVYIDPPTGAVVEFYNGKEFKEYIES